MGRTFLPTIRRYPDFAQVPWTPAEGAMPPHMEHFFPAHVFFPFFFSNTTIHPIPSSILSSHTLNILHQHSSTSSATRALELAPYYPHPQFPSLLRFGAMHLTCYLPLILALIGTSSASLFHRSAVAKREDEPTPFKLKTVVINGGDSNLGGLYVQSYHTGENFLTPPVLSWLEGVLDAHVCLRCRCWTQ